MLRYDPLCQRDSEQLYPYEEDFRWTHCQCQVKTVYHRLKSTSIEYDSLYFLNKLLYIIHSSVKTGKTELHAPFIEWSKTSATYEKSRTAQNKYDVLFKYLIDTQILMENGRLLLFFIHLT